MFLVLENRPSISVSDEIMLVMSVNDEIISVLRMGYDFVEDCFRRSCLGSLIEPQRFSSSDVFYWLSAGARGCPLLRS